ncbi:recombinase family protein [Clostridium tertium]|uniref:recombinase family protein n=1 Tax=Clostridium tertium TaxID=1559 RepID=UPI002330D40E|nr:recombinase family protein [Clostridium tertium]MDB1954210.1 recombinase family protein [Clostridium tertium]MDB1957847.1 recombinase family protein [Clostridium tertium]MDB1961701.1 recombinase family protein [Clostridium tertium]MDB1965044.1 recombinase family protein [Clostridium tertium]
MKEDEAAVVRKMFDLCIQGYGYVKISQMLAEEGIYNPKGKAFAMSTIKNMIHNKKYCGYNVRNQWESRNLFSENHSHCRTKKENWIIQKNDRIEPIISEETWNLAQEQIKLRLLHQNTGGTVERRDTSDKIICNCCGKNFYICHSRKIDSGINSYPYYICSTKKKQGKNVCDNDNVQVKKVDAFIDDLAKNYYKNIRLSNKAKLIKLQGELKKLKNRSVKEINDECEVIKSENAHNEEQLSKLIDNFLDCSDVMKKVIDKKINNLELTIKNNNDRILELERSKANIDSDKIGIEKKIKDIKKELSKIDTVELTREELMEKIKCIKVDKGNNFIVEYL